MYGAGRNFTNQGDAKEEGHGGDQREADIFAIEEVFHEQHSQAGSHEDFRMVSG